MAETLTFRDFVLSVAAVTDDPCGDFITDARWAASRPSRGFPEIASLRELVAYLEREMACLEAIDAGRTAWRRYQSKLKRDPAKVPLNSGRPRPLLKYNVFSTGGGERVLERQVEGYVEAVRWRRKLWTLPDGSRAKYTVELAA